MRSFQHCIASSLLLCSPFALALDIDVNNTQSVSSAAKTIVENIISIYHDSNSTEIPGIFPKPYYWWESGLAFDSLVNYWAQTGDATYNDLVSEALVFQVGPDKDYMPTNQTSSEGNDAQAIWALAAMTAAEKGFPAPASSSGVDSWLQLAQNVFDAQVLRWDTQSCGGGLRWQISAFNNGYNYKNSDSTGFFMQLSSRLFRYTGNQTYSDWASKASQWSFDVGLIDNSTLAVYDGASVQNQCKNINKVQFTAALGTYLSANIYLYNATKANQWKANIAGLYIHAIETFANNSAGVLEEVACAPDNTCNTDQIAFRSVLARALANAEALAPSLQYAGSLSSLIDKSAEGAASQCSGGQNKTTCGSNWSTMKWDGTQGLSQDLSALEIILAAMPSAGQSGVRTENSTGTTGHSSGSETSSGASPTNTNDARRKGISVLVLVASLAFAYFVSV